MRTKHLIIAIILLILSSCTNSYDSNWPTDPKEGRYCVKSCELMKEDCMNLCNNIPACETSSVGIDRVKVYNCYDQVNYCNRVYHGTYNSDEQCFIGPHEYCRDIFIKGFDPCDFQPCSERCSRRYDYCFNNCNY